MDQDIQTARSTAPPDTARGPEQPDGGPPRPRPRRPLAWLSWVGVVACVLVLALTAALSVVSYRIDRHNEHRLLNLDAKQTVTVLQAALPTIETSLASAAEIAATSDGSAAAFRSYMSAYVGRAGPFAAATLWRVDARGVGLVASVGQPTVLAAVPARADQVLARAAKQTAVSLVGPLALSSPRPRLGYAYAAGRTAMYVVYAESLLPAGRRATVPPGSAFSDLHFALYVGRAETPDKLLEANVAHGNVPGDTVRVIVPWGASALTLVAGARGHLGGGLSAALWWIVIIVGILLSLLAALAVEHLVRGRRTAELATAHTQELLVAQRDIARTLQQALLPETVPVVPGLRAEARYVAGGDVDIGGDWYDLLPLHDGRAFFVVGDVSGRGLRAGTTMAALRFAIHGFVSEGHPPATTLDRLAAMVDVGRDGQFATVLCAVLDIERRELSLASAGHLPPLLVGAGTSRYVEAPVGPPIGVACERAYQAVTVPVPPEAVLLGFTDGLVERRGESLDQGLERLRSTIGPAASLAEVFERLASGMASASSDDIAILGVQWLS